MMFIRFVGMITENNKELVAVNAAATEKEKEWVKKISEGKSYIEISREDGITLNVLAYKLTALRQRFNCLSSSHLVGVFLRNKLID